MNQVSGRERDWREKKNLSGFLDLEEELEACDELSGITENNPGVFLG